MSFNIIQDLQKHEQTQQELIQKIKILENMNFELQKQDEKQIEQKFDQKIQQLQDKHKYEMNKQKDMYLDKILQLENEVEFIREHLQTQFFIKYKLQDKGLVDGQIVLLRSYTGFRIKVYLITLQQFEIDACQIYSIKATKHDPYELKISILIQEINHETEKELVVEKQFQNVHFNYQGDISYLIRILTIFQKDALKDLQKRQELQQQYQKTRLTKNFKILDIAKNIFQLNKKQKKIDKNQINQIDIFKIKDRNKSVIMSNLNSDVDGKNNQLIDFDNSSNQKY